MLFKEFLKITKTLFSTVKLTQEPLIDGTLIQYDGDEMVIGETIYRASGSETSVLPDGLYTTKKGLKFTIEQGVVSNIDKGTYIASQPLPDPLPQGTNNVSVDKYGSDKVSKVNPEYGDVIYADPGYQTDKKKRYPIDTEEHIRAAWNYINKEGNGSEYSVDELSNIKNKIISAWKEKIDPLGPPSVQKQNKDEMSEVKDVELAKDKKEKDNSVEPGGAKDTDTTLPVSVDTVDTVSGAGDWANQMGKVSKTIGDHAQALKDLKASVDDFQKQLGKFASMETELKETKEKLEKFSKQPAGVPIETSLNPFKKPDVEITESRAYKIMHAPLK